MRTRLNIQKSIEKQRLIYQPTASFLFSKFFENVRWLAFIAVPILLISNEKNNIGIIGYFTLGILTLLFLIGLYLTNILLVIKGVSLLENRKRMIELVREEFPDWEFTDNEQHIIRRNKNTGLFSWGKQLIIIFNDADILINLATLGRAEIKSPFHSIFNYFKMKRLSKSF